ncbi:MAG: respiratory chain complex I subunit 1 family protein [Armatimonadota bacterium]
MIALFFAVNLLIVPLLLVGVIRKVKALMQTRIGAPILQPFYDITKLLRKGETISHTASWVFVWAPRIGLCLALLVAALVPWAGPLLPAGWAAATNFLLIIYLMALGKFIGMLSAMDTGSAFGGLGASREATISLLVEPAMVLALGALALGARSTDLSAIFTAPMHPLTALLVGVVLVIAALAELSRMPVDDPTTHLELTMVHEAMILENSGRNLALIEYAVAVRSCVLLGIAAQTLLHVWRGFADLPLSTQYGISLGALFLTGIAVAVAEGLLVKMKWRRVPNFLAAAIVMSLFAALLAAALR